MQTQGKQLTKKTTATIALPEEVANTAWGAEQTDIEDLVIPKILVAQSNSPFVLEGQAKAGELYHTGYEKVVGSADIECLIVPIFYYKTHEHSVHDGNKFKLKDTAPYSAIKHKEIKYYNEDHTERNENVHNVYFALAEDLGTNNPPALVRFRGYGFRNGTKIAHHFNICRADKKPPAKMMFKLTTALTKNDKGTFFIPDITTACATKDWEAVAPVLFNWWKTISNGMQTATVKVADVPDESEETVPF